MTRALRLVPDAPLPAHLTETPEDREREQRIEQLASKLKGAQAFGAVKKAYELQEQMRLEIAARSPAQVERMERRMGLRR